MKSLAKIWKAIGVAGGPVFRTDVARLSDVDLGTFRDLAAAAAELAETEFRVRAHERKVAAARIVADSEDLSPEVRKEARQLLWGEFGIGEKPCVSCLPVTSKLGSSEAMVCATCGGPVPEAKP